MIAPAIAARASATASTRTGRSRPTPRSSARRASFSFDAAVAMYHDQGLIALKTLEFDRAVNVTIGIALRPHLARSRHRVRYRGQGSRESFEHDRRDRIRVAGRDQPRRDAAPGGGITSDGRSNRHQGRARAQSQEHRPRDSARSPGRDHRALRLGQILARLRHDLRRGPAPLRRVAVGLRAPVPRADGEARRRFDRRAVAGDLDRAEDHLAQSALDGRHHHRNLRLPAPAVRARRHTRSATTAAAKSRSRACSRSSIASWRGPRARGSTCSRRSCAIARASIARSWPTCARRLRARQDRRQAPRARRRADAQQESAPHHRGDGRSARDSQRNREAAGRLARSRVQVRPGPAQGRAARRPQERERRFISASASPASIAESRIRRSRRGCSRSTVRTARAPNARASDRSCTSIRSWSCRTKT